MPRAGRTLPYTAPRAAYDTQSSVARPVQPAPRSTCPCVFPCQCTQNEEESAAGQTETGEPLHPDQVNTSQSDDDQSSAHGNNTPPSPQKQPVTTQLTSPGSQSQTPPYCEPRAPLFCKNPAEYVHVRKRSKVKLNQQALQTIAEHSVVTPAPEPPPKPKPQPMLPPQPNAQPRLPPRPSQPSQFKTTFRHVTSQAPQAHYPFNPAGAHPQLHHPDIERVLNHVSNMAAQVAMGVLGTANTQAVQMVAMQAAEVYMRNMHMVAARAAERGIDMHGAPMAAALAAMSELDIRGFAKCAARDMARMLAARNQQTSMHGAPMAAGPAATTGADTTAAAHEAMPGANMHGFPPSAARDMADVLATRDPQAVAAQIRSLPRSVRKQVQRQAAQCHVIAGGVGVSIGTGPGRVFIHQAQPSYGPLQQQVQYHHAAHHATYDAP